MSQVNRAALWFSSNLFSLKTKPCLTNCPYASSTAAPIEDLFIYRAWARQQGTRSAGGTHLAWELLRDVADLGEHSSLREALRFGQRPTAELVDAHCLQCRPIRNVLIRYLDERRPALDYNTFHRLCACLAGTFWADIEHHHPGIDTLHLPDDVAEAWKQRLRVLTSTDGSTRPLPEKVHTTPPPTRARPSSSRRPGWPQPRA